MSILTRLAQAASAYIRARMASAPSRARTRGPAARPPGDGTVPRMSGAPPVVGGGRQPPRPPITGNAPTGDDDDEFDNVQILGRDQTSEVDGIDQITSKLRLVNSSNVYGYTFTLETPQMGILYVTFLEYVPKAAGGSGERGDGPGPTYAYYDFPLAKYRQFESMAASSAGGAVWDYCRVRHSVYEHQHSYRLVAASGEYVPRRAMAGGFKDRAVADPGMGRRGFKRSTLPAQAMKTSRQLPTRSYASNNNNGAPNRGTPNRGEPNRG